MNTNHSRRRLAGARVARLQVAGGSRYFPCLRTANRTQLCFALCQPVGGMGDCGRAAGHAQLGRTQLAILEHSRRRQAAADAPDRS
jgi:hypothetical protein